MLFSVFSVSSEITTVYPPNRDSVCVQVLKCAGRIILTSQITGRGRVIRPRLDTVVRARSKFYFLGLRYGLLGRALKSPLSV